MWASRIFIRRAAMRHSAASKSNSRHSAMRSSPGRTKVSGASLAVRARWPVALRSRRLRVRSSPMRPGSVMDAWFFATTGARAPRRSASTSRTSTACSDRISQDLPDRCLVGAPFVRSRRFNVAKRLKTSGRRYLCDRMRPQFGEDMRLEHPRALPKRDRRDLPACNAIHSRATPRKSCPGPPWRCVARRLGRCPQQ